MCPGTTPVSTKTVVIGDSIAEESTPFLEMFRPA